MAKIPPRGTLKRKAKEKFPQVLAAVTLLSSFFVVYAIATNVEWVRYVLMKYNGFSIRGFVEPRPEDIHFCQAWFLSAIIVNAISVVCGIVAITVLTPKEDWNPVSFVGMGSVLALSAASLFVVRYHTDIFPTLVALSVFLVYTVTDLVSLRRTRRSSTDPRLSKYPLLMIDLPGLLLTGFFAIYSRKIRNVEFAAGSTAAIVLATSITFIMLCAFIFVEREVE